MKRIRLLWSVWGDRKPCSLRDEIASRVLFSRNHSFAASTLWLTADRWKTPANPPSIATVVGPFYILWLYNIVSFYALPITNRWICCKTEQKTRYNQLDHHKNIHTILIHSLTKNTAQTVTHNTHFICRLPFRFISCQLLLIPSINNKKKE